MHGRTFDDGLGGTLLFLLNLRVAGLNLPDLAVLFVELVAHGVQHGDIARKGAYQTDAAVFVKNGDAAQHEFFAVAQGLHAGNRFAFAHDFRIQNQIKTAFGDNVAHLSAAQLSERKAGELFINAIHKQGGAVHIGDKHAIGHGIQDIFHLGGNDIAFRLWHGR